MEPSRGAITATNVCTGSPHLFGNAQINADVLLASACLPLMHQAIEVDVDAYWDVFVARLAPGFSSAIALARAIKKGLL
jgi:hypothetical protein